MWAEAETLEIEENVLEYLKKMLNSSVLQLR
jgi:hypothetical protein